jgi:hypothetical protein
VHRRRAQRPHCLQHARCWLSTGSMRRRSKAPVAAVALPKVTCWRQTRLKRHGQRDLACRHPPRRHPPRQHQQRGRRRRRRPLHPRAARHWQRGLPQRDRARSSACRCHACASASPSAWSNRNRQRPC